MKIREIAALVKGEVISDAEIDIKGAAGISDASEGDVTFLSSSKLLHDCVNSKASCVIVKKEEPALIQGTPYLIIDLEI